MTARPPAATSDSAAMLARSEAQLRVLHELRVEARLRPDFEAHYVGFLRALRERLHPRGVYDARTIRLANGLTFQVDLGDRLGCDVFYGYYDERFEAGLFVELLAAGQTMFDVGANFGYYAVHCAHAVGAAGAVHAFEPDPAAAALLRENACANGLDGWLTHHAAAVSDHNGATEYHLAEEAAFSGMTSTGRSAVRGVVQVPTRSLDSVAAEHGVTAIDALKIDVEGHEAKVLRGAAGLLERSPDPLVMLEVSAKNLTDEARSALTAALRPIFAAGFVGLIPDLSSGAGLRAVITPTEAASLPSANLLLVRAGGERERQLRAAVARRRSTASPLLDVEPVDADARVLRLVAGPDPEFIAAALRDKSDAEGRATTLAAEVSELRTEIGRLRAERAALRAEVRRLGSTPVGLAVRAALKLARTVVGGQR
ncbi:MAG: FkbM family methyltransferase [Chloroflexi bacterium]|nr:FkbM family methyltransferase [Chloroflexota bacterium]